MTPGFIRWGLVGFLLGLAFMFTQCGKPFATKGDLIYSVDGVGVVSPIAGGTAESSLSAFQQTVYPLTRSHCVSCHGGSQTPLHASSDPAVAHNAVLQKVNFTDPSNSRMVRKLRDESHHCWTSCSQSAQIMQDAIAEWTSRMTTVNTDPPGGTNDYNLVTGQSQTVAQERQLVTAGAFLMTSSAGTAMYSTPFVYNSTISPGFIEAPNDGSNQTFSSTDPAAGQATFAMSSMANRTGGALWGLVQAAANNDDSFFIKMNNGNLIQWNIPDTNGKFQWVRVPNNYNVNAGNNVVTVREREDGTKIAMLLWTQDQNFVPTGAGTAGEIKLTFPLSTLLGGVSGVSLEVKLNDYDSYSYKLTSLRLNNTSGRMIYVKNIRLMLNGHYSPQNANYTYVDQTVPNGGANLNPGSMIVLKEKGEAVDKLSFAFEILEVR
ncbi:MAG: hypothetical protein K2P81_05365 [Bacteriovoracaceae bacterium]|nr:hypothetical protein [Bacteriovoracaceae bacterium]